MTTLLAVEAHDRARRMLGFGMALHAVWLLVCSLAYPFETRTVNDINVWIKPIKFQLSLGLMLLTVWLLLPLLPRGLRATRRLRAACAVLVGAAVFDLLLFTLQSARGTASHFNHATRLDSTLYSASGVAALLMVVTVTWLGWQLWRHRPSAGVAGVHRGLMLGAAWGLMLGALLTLVTAGIMSAEVLVRTGHWVGGAGSDASGLPLVGWSTTGGDLRVPHFFATHLMQALPLLGWALDRWAPAGRVDGLLGAGALLGVAVVAGTFVQAAKGIPFLG